MKKERPKKKTVAVKQLGDGLATVECPLCRSIFVINLPQNSSPCCHKGEFRNEQPFDPYNPQVQTC